MRVVLAQIDSKLNKESNLKKHIEIINSNKSSADLIIFPELSLNGYLLMDAVYSDSFILDELDDLISLSYDIDILVGVALKQSSKFYNSAIYFAKGKYHIHNKVTLPNYGMFEEARFFFGGDNILSFDTDYGKSVVAICEDLWSSQNIDKIVSLNPDTVFILAASPARGFESDGLEIEAQWDSILRTVALLSGAYVVFVNRVGFEDGLGFWGGSRVINPKGLDEFKLPLIDEKVDSFLINHQLSHTQKYIKRNK